MSVKNTLKKSVPAYRVGMYILDEITALSKKVDRLQKSVADLDYKNEYLFWMTQKLAEESPMEAKKRVFAKMPKASGITRKIQLTNNYILQRTKIICDENGIEFFLLYGTLIGALRHEGFIPWDDDIDIGMMREDYEKFVEAIKNDSELEVNNYYQYPYNKRQIKIKLKESDAFFVDIFLQDEVDANDSNFEEIENRISDMHAEYTERMRLLYRETGVNTRICRPTKNKSLDNKADRIAKDICCKYPFYGHGDYICISVEDTGMWEQTGKAWLRKRDELFPLVKSGVLFEGMRYDVYNCYESLLEEIYGNIWDLPKCMRLTHGEEFAELSEKDLEIMDRITKNSLI